MKAKTATLLGMQPEVSDMDPYVVKLLLQQSRIQENQLAKKASGESESEEEELNLEWWMELHIWSEWNQKIN